MKIQLQFLEKENDRKQAIDLADFLNRQKELSLYADSAFIEKQKTLPNQQSIAGLTAFVILFFKTNQQAIIALTNVLIAYIDSRKTSIKLTNGNKQLELNTGKMSHKEIRVLMKDFLK